MTMETLRISANLASLVTASEFVLGCADRAALAEELRLHLELVIEEIFVNVASYAYENSEGDLDISCWKDETSFSVSFTDSGKAFNPLEMLPPDLSDDIEKRPIGGLGIYLVKNVADSVSYERRGPLNVLTVKFRLGK